MHKLTLPFSLLLFVGFQPVKAQKHDYMWPLGLRPEISEFRFFYDFESSDIIVRSDTICNAKFSSAYCDADGNILVFSNGLSIFDRNGSILENGGGLNPTVTEWQTASSYPGGQSGFFLAKPDDPNIVYFISLDFGLHPAQKWPYIYVGQNLMIATIDVTANNGAGKVTEKNKILLTGTLMSPNACRHANGRDWWIMVSDADENRHYRVLLTPEGFSAPDTQHIGTKPNPIPYEGGNKSNQIAGNCFSPHGKYYADINDNLGFSIYQFNRCSGLLSDERRVEYPPPTHPYYHQNESGSGAVFSQNDSFFYKTTRYSVGSFPAAPLGTIPYLLQFELSSSDLASTVDTINIIDSSDYHLPFNITWDKFLGAELGPDGRIYIVHSGLGYCTVQYPNVRGKDCKFVHDKPFFNVVIGSAIPYMPNYRLGPLDGSPCDTLGLNNTPVANFRVDDTLGYLSRYFYDLSHHEPALWHWDFGDSTNSTEQSPLHQYNNPGIYQVCLTVSNQYGSNTYCRTLYIGVSGTAGHVQNSQVVVSPNPFTRRLEVSLNVTLRSPVFLLYDAVGRLVRRERMANEINEIQVADLNKGMYFWKILSNGEYVKAGKIIKTD
ncbi:MAG: PKD domain-containing protein [Saprospiraceae bacterium]